MTDTSFFDNEAEPRPRNRTRRGVGLLFAAIGMLVSLGLIAVGVLVWWVGAAAGGIQRTDSLLPTDNTSRPAATAAAVDSMNVVLMGSDSRGEDQGRSDVLMLAHVPPARDGVYLISFPRDMWVLIPGRGYAKINAAYAFGGEQLTVKTLESLVGVRMDHAAKIDFEGFVGLTTELGGVSVNNAVASSEGGYSWPKGSITIQGEEALAYVRQRHGLPNGDLDRAERQRAVVKAVVVKMMSGDVLTDPLRLFSVLGKVSQYVTVDGGLTNQELLTTATSMKLGGASDLVSLQAPISGLGTSPDGQSIDIVDEAQLAELATAIRTGTMADYAEKYDGQG